MIRLADAAEGVRSIPALAGARHFFRESPNPRSAGVCVKCGRGRKDSVHAYMDLAHRAAISAHLAMAQNAVQAGDLDEAIRQAAVAIRLAQEA